MKKLLAAMMIAMFAITLSACDPEDVEDPVVEVDCEANPEDPACVEDLECDPGYEDINGTCVLIDGRSPEEIAADLVEDNFDGSMEHMELLLENMDFDDAMTMITEYNVDVTDPEGVDHLINLVVTDEVVNGEFGITKRTVEGEYVDGEEVEEFNFVLIIEETNTGFIVYYDTTFLRSILAEEAETEIQDVLDTLDANGTWFMFKFDDSLANLVEFEVLKEMAVAALYQEVGTFIWEELEDQIDYALGVTLSIYGFDFTTFVDHIIDSEYDEAELLLENVDVDSLVFDLDQLHVVPQIVDYFNYIDFWDNRYEVYNMIPTVSPEGYMNWWNYDYDGDTMEISVKFEDPANFALLEAQILELPWVESMSSTPEVPDGMMIMWDKTYTITCIPEFITNMLELDPTFDVDAEILFLETYGTEAWLEQLTDQEIINYLTIEEPIVGEAYEAYVDGVLDHWIIMNVLDDYDVQMALAEIPGLDVTAFVETMDLLDYDALYLEEVDPEALAQAIYDGYAAYDTYVGELYATAPESASILVHFGGMGGAVDYIQQYMVYVDDVMLGFENLVMFEDYITPEYYLGIDLLDVTLEVNDDFEIISVGTVDFSTTSQLFEDFTADLYGYLDAFETFDLPYVEQFNCPELQTCEDWTEYPEIVEGLSGLGEVVLTAQYDPFNRDELFVEIQFEDLANSLILIGDETDTTVVNDLSITITMLTEADPEVPTEDVTDVNQKVEDFAKFSLVMEAYDYLRKIEEYYMMYPMQMPTVNTSFVSINNFVGVSVAFDESASYFKPIPDGLGGYDWELTLVWLDGTAVFTDALLLSELEVQFGEDTGAPDRAEFVMWMEKVDSENFNMTKLFLVYMWERDDYNYYPMPPM